MSADDSIPDFTNFTHPLVTPPADPRGCGWDKLKECERRLAWYRWAEQRDDPRKVQQRVVLDDCLSAFLLTLEATLQFMWGQLWEQLKARGVTPKCKLNQWLKKLPEYDLQMKGLRTLRHFAAHVEIKRAPSEVTQTYGARYVLVGESAPDGTSEPTVTRRWLLPQLDRVDLQKLNTHALDDRDLPDWNTLVQSNDAASILEHGLRQVHAILQKAEKLL